MSGATDMPPDGDATNIRVERRDVAGDLLARICTPSLLIVGGLDPEVLELNRRALTRLTGPEMLEIVPGASHLFPEPGALHAVVDHTARWFRRYLLQSPESGMHVSPH